MTDNAQNTFAAIHRIFEVIESRRDGDQAKSYVAKQFSKGRDKIAEKVGEEAVETVIAAVRGGKKEIISESADLLFHLMILWADSGISPNEILDELVRREGMSGLVEKKQRRKFKNDL